MKTKIIFIFVCFFVCIYLPSAAADKQGKKIIRVGIFSMEPLNFLDKNNTATGLLPTLVDKIADKENWAVTYVPGTWAQCLERLEAGKIDLMTPIAYSPERARTIDFNKEPVVDIWGQVFVRPDGQIQSILDLHKQTVAVMKKGINGSNFITTAGNFGVYCKILEFDSHADVFQAVRDRRAVAGVAPQHFGLRHAKAFDLVGTSIQFSPFSVYFGVKKGHNKDLLDRIDLHLAQWKKDKSSEYYKDLSFWMGGKNFEHIVIPEWLLLSLVGAGLVSLLLFFFNRMLKAQVVKKTRALRESEKQYRELVESADTVILRWDCSGNGIFLNRFGLSLFGCSQEDVPGRPIIDILPSFKKFPEDKRKSIIKKIISAPKDHALVETTHLDDHHHPVFIQWSNKAILKEDGSIEEILSVGTDITQRKQLEKQLLASQKIEAIGTLAGGIAHDFNNILMVIMGNAELAFSNKTDPEKVTAYIDRILSAAHRARELTGQILTFSRESNFEKIPVNLGDIIDDALAMIRSTLPTTIHITTRIDSRNIILANPTQMHQILLNLCTNAFHAMEEHGGTLTVTLHQIRLDDAAILSEGLEIRTGDYLLLKISDTGYGMDKETIAKIFEPYFTTKNRGKGTGMGLAVVHGIIRDHKGAIQVFSSKGQGTTFHVYLPMTDEPAVQKTKNREETVQIGNETLMIVDDEPVIISTLSTILSSNGYTIEGFTSSRKALSAFKANPNRYDLVITDMTMPEMTGVQFSRELMSLKPCPPIILCTGFSTLVTREKALKLGISEYLQKPILKNDLLNTIRKVLDSRQT